MPADYCFNIIWEINNLYFKRERGGGGEAAEGVYPTPVTFCDLLVCSS